MCLKICYVIEVTWQNWFDCKFCHVKKIIEVAWQNQSDCKFRNGQYFIMGIFAHDKIDPITSFAMWNILLWAFLYMTKSIGLQISPCEIFCYVIDVTWQNRSDYKFCNVKYFAMGIFVHDKIDRIANFAMCLKICYVIEVTWQNWFDCKFCHVKKIIEVAWQNQSDCKFRNGQYFIMGIFAHDKIDPITSFAMWNILLWAFLYMTKSIKSQILQCEILCYVIEVTWQNRSDSKFCHVKYFAMYNMTKSIG